jgi:hypothetical protein
MSDRLKKPPTCARCSQPIVRARERAFVSGAAVHVRCTDRSLMEDAYLDEARGLQDMAAGEPVEIPVPGFMPPGPYFQVRARGEAIYDRERAP